MQVVALQSQRLLNLFYFLVLHAGVEGLDQLDRVIGELDQTGESTEQLRTEAARLRQHYSDRKSVV